MPVFWQSPLPRVMARHVRRAFAFAAAVLSISASCVGGARAGTDYTIQARDELSIQVVGVEALTRDLTVLPDGTISYPLVGTVTAAGQTAAALSQELALRLQRYVHDPQVSVTLVKTAQMTVLVLGNVKQPGRYELDRGARLSDALAAAGGLGPTNGPLPDARVDHTGEQPAVVSLEAMMRKGDVSLDRTLVDRDTVYVVSPTTFNVTVLGSVDHAGLVTVQEGDRIWSAIATAGVSTSSQADLSHVRYTHTGDDGRPKTTTVDVLASLQRGNFSRDPVLQKGDVVFVPLSKHGAFAGLGVDLYYLIAGLRLLTVPL